MTPDPVETALREREARYRSALHAGRMGSWETDFVAGTRTWSKEGMALFGLELPEGRGQVGGDGDEYAAALHPDDRHLATDFHALADRQDSFFAEYRIVHPDGTVLWLSGRGLVMSRGPDGRAERLVSIMADVS
ncbi:MAG TPA: PAS domain-containing protein, partial [Caldimonas sp.]